MKIFCFFILFSILTSCSTLPKQKQVLTVNFETGENLFEKAVQHEKLKNHRTALWYYSEAKKYFEINNYQSNVLACLFGIKRNAFLLKEQDILSEITYEIENIYLPFNNEMIPVYQLLQTELLFYQAEVNYENIVSLLSEKKYKRLSNELRRLSMLCLAQEKLKKDNNCYTELKKSIIVAERLYKKHRLEDPGALSYACFVAGLIESNKDKVSAFKFFRKSMAIDQKLENDTGIALNLLQLGMIEKNNQNYSHAESYLYRANKIFQLIGDFYHAEYSQAHYYLCLSRKPDSGISEQDLINFLNKLEHIEIKEIILKKLE